MIYRFSLLISIVILSSCGDSSNSRVFKSNEKFVPEAQTCKPGCFGIPQEWYDLGLVVDENGQPLTTQDPLVKKHGACYFKVCDDESLYTLDAKEYKTRFGGDIIVETDPIKCGNLSSYAIQVQSTEQGSSSGIDFDNIDC